MIAALDMSDAGAPGRLGPYELTSAIGAGGMGHVYRARDTRLDRTVAIKILKDAFSHRFEREARAISALHHPHICTLYDIGRHGDTPYLVMEYVQGKPLAGPLSVQETLEYGAQTPMRCRPRTGPASSTAISNPAISWSTAPVSRCSTSVWPASSRRWRRLARGRPVQSPSTARFWARSATWRPSSSRGATPTRAATSSRSG